MQKSFFKKRTPQEMRALKVTRVYSPRDLITRITNSNNITEALELRFPLIPQQFRRTESQARDSRKHYKHGHLITLPQLKTRAEAQNYPYTPLLARMQAFETAFKNVKEEEIYTIGYQWQPVQGNDRRWRVVPFDVCLEGAKLYNYALNQAGGMPLKAYDTATRVVQEGAQVHVSVPSRTKRRERYEIMLKHVPTCNIPTKNAIILSLGSNFVGQGEPERKQFLHELRYQWQSEQKDSEVCVFTPHEIAAYHAIIRHYWKGLENTIPLEMNPFCLPSQEEARLYDKLQNNISIFDPTLQGKEKVRNLHLDEICTLLARSMKARGVYSTMFWDPQRDGKLSQYWS